jgi:chemotaxis protein MotA
MGSPKPKKNMDIATLLGIALAVGCIVGGLVMEGGKLSDLAQVTAAIIVLGGTIGAVLVTTPLPVFSSAVRRLAGIVLSEAQPVAETLSVLVRCAEQARRSGLASLEDVGARISDPFLSKAINLAADGTDIREIEEMLRLDIAVGEERGENEAKVWENAAGYSPTIGIIGAVLGLIQVMKHLDKLDEVGRGIAVAFVATIYGVASANILFLPAAGKLRSRDRERVQLQEIIVEGVLGIVAGMNPKLMRIKLDAYLRGAVGSAAPREASGERFSAQTVPSP